MAKGIVTAASCAKKSAATFSRLESTRTWSSSEASCRRSSLLALRFGAFSAVTNVRSLPLPLRTGPEEMSLEAGAGSSGGAQAVVGSPGGEGVGSGAECGGEVDAAGTEAGGGGQIGVSWMGDGGGGETRAAGGGEVGEGGATAAGTVGGEGVDVDAAGPVPAGSPGSGLRTDLRIEDKVSERRLWLGLGSGGGGLGFLRGHLRVYTLISDAHRDLAGAGAATAGSSPAAPPSPVDADAMHKPYVRTMEGPDSMGLGRGPPRCLEKFHVSAAVAVAPRASVGFVLCTTARAPRGNKAVSPPPLPLVYMGLVGFFFGPEYGPL
jgi:hypothetical protein